LEFIFVIIVIAAAAAYTIRSLYRKASGGKKSCGCADGCPISEKCNPDRRPARRKNGEITSSAANKHGR